MMIAIEPARGADLPAILGLLERSGLPADGLSDHVGTALIARQEGAVVGCAALEAYGSFALLRSVAVDPSLRGQGLGQGLTQAALDLARRLGMTAVYLLTETAGEFYPRFGFRAIDRADVPAAVRQSVEFTHACPTSALTMALVFDATMKSKSAVGGV